MLGYWSALVWNVIISVFTSVMADLECYYD